jgi:hypothetical protein
MPYAFEMMPNLTEIQAYDGDEIVFFPHNETNNYSEKYSGWPGFYDYTLDANGNVTNKTSNAEGYSLVQAFDRCPKLTRIEPILNVKYFPTADFVY